MPSKPARVTECEARRVAKRVASHGSRVVNKRTKKAAAGVWRTPRGGEGSGDSHTRSAAALAFQQSDLEGPGLALLSAGGNPA